ncbi:SMC-Scp complex subunit ScpB [Chitinilyticum piscinae]|uniref:SMC-Scp complex subunit ScpB n=1 Tax=Chitinilyticum piscinae TaxID=2866724 RepID=A0A8J7FKG8_9NEIS|nr:SMC-Scp complex subunit ScpB [Chitinilyticum piscinae]MBE9609315.1 SMC-Scp complex subunit ScpB [Chitinilyticum piscinae]
MSEIDRRHLKNVIEAALLVNQEPLSVAQLKALFGVPPEGAELVAVLEELQRDWDGRGVELVRLANGWRFRARLDMQPYLERLKPEKPPRYSRAVMETLAIIAYKQPVTRGEIEEIRGVTVSSAIIQTLKERGWIDVVGHKEVPGRPELLATTRDFLADLGLASLKDLPPLTELGNLVVPDLADAAAAASPQE